jgi:glycosidase
VRAATHTGAPLAVEADPDSGRVLVRGPATPGKHSVTLTASDTDGRGGRARASRWVGPRDWRDEILYQVMIDRFRATDGTALAPPATAGTRAGGTLPGVTSAVRDGSLAELGVTALWLSPVYLNPDEARLGNDGRLYEGYHGYWPLAPRTVDPRLGGEAALDELVAEAHARNLALMLDVVPNHVYEGHPIYQAHQDDGWFSAPGCVCGTTDCPWYGNIERCWFAPYLPDIRWQSSEAARNAVDDVAWWTERFDLDGVRIDAVPMMPRAATRRLVDRLRRQTLPREATFALGEIFTGPGPEAVAQLRYQLGPAGLDSVFDFPLMWALRAAIAKGSGDFAAVEAVLAHEEEELAGSGAVLARMLDNHDTPRFLSAAVGDEGGDPWTSPASQPVDPEPYRRLELGLAMIFALPGMPVLFQGDEVGLAGAGDPDCRRVLPADAALSPPMRHVRDTTARLASLRRCSLALRRGERTALVAGSHFYAMLRDAGGLDRAVVLLSSSLVSQSIELAGVPAGEYQDALSGEVLTLADQGASVPMPPLAFRVLLPRGDACVAAGTSP